MNLDQSYPYKAGFKDPTTSRDNAKRTENSGRAATLRALVWSYFEAGNKATADEVAEFLNEPFRAIQPRVSELKAQGFIKPSGERRLGSGGGTCHVWIKA